MKNTKPENQDYPHILKWQSSKKKAKKIKKKD